MYKIIYNHLGIPASVQREDGACIGISNDNRDFIKFLEWNAEQETPLDLEGNKMTNIIGDINEYD